MLTNPIVKACYKKLARLNRSGGNYVSAYQGAQDLEQMPPCRETLKCRWFASFRFNSVKLSAAEKLLEQLPKMER